MKTLFTIIFLTATIHWPHISESQRIELCTRASLAVMPQDRTYEFKECYKRLNY